MKLNFTIEGEYISTTAKNLVLEKNWEGAVRVLSQCNNDGQMDLIFKILNGDMKLAGEDDKIYATEDNDEEYKETLKYVYAGSTQINGAWYKPSFYVNTIKSTSECIDERIEIYSQREKYPTLFLIVDGEEQLVFFEKTVSPPVWINSYILRTTQEALDEFISLKSKSFECLGVVLENVQYNQKDIVNDLIDYIDLDISKYAKSQEIYARESLQDEIMLKYYKEKIIVQETEWISIKGLKIPKTPFLHWVTYYLRNHKDQNPFENYELKEWKLCCPKGLKMMGDNPYHTDWVVGAGLNPDTFYDSKEEQIINDFIFHVSNRNMIVLNGTGTISGIVEMDPEKVTENSILVIPHAGVEYFEAAKKVAVVISAVGGPAAHLCLNAKEYNVNLALVRNAMTEFKQGESYQISLDLGVFSWERV